MFREMRRFKQLLTKEESVAILEQGTEGVLAVIGDEGYPYAVPMSYFYKNDKIYLHCASVGHKIDAIVNCPKVSFCVVDKKEIVPQKNTVCFSSVIAFGKAKLLEESQKKEALRPLAEKYNPTFHEEREKALNGNLSSMAMIEIEIEHLSGKESMELIKRRTV